MAFRHSPEREADAARMITELFPVTESEGEEAPPSVPTASPPPKVQARPPAGAQARPPANAPTRQPANVQARQAAGVQPQQVANPFELPALPQRPATKRLKDLPLQTADIALQSAQFPGAPFPGRMPEIQLRPEPAGGDWHGTASAPGESSHSNVRWLTVAVVLVWTVAGLIWITGPLWPVQSFPPPALSTEAASHSAPDADRTVATTGISETPVAKVPESPAAGSLEIPTTSRAPEVSARQATRLDTSASAPTRIDRTPAAAVAAAPPPRPAVVQPPSRLPVAPTPPPVRAASEPNVTTPASRPTETPASRPTTETPAAAPARGAAIMPVDRPPADPPAASPSAPPPAINPAVTPPESVVAAATPPPVSPPTAASTVANSPASVPASPAETSAASTAAGAAAIPSSTRAADIQAVERVLGRYRAAYEGLDAAAARRVWPKVNSSALERAFAQLEQQGMSFDRCEIGIYGALAQASCSGTARYVPRSGSKTPRVDRRQWTFRLRKGTEDWTIDSVDVR